MEDHTIEPAPRRAWSAALLSVLTPGLGHLYAGRPGRGVLIAFVVVPLGTALGLVALLAIRVAPLNVVLTLMLVIAVVVAVPVHAATTARGAPSDYVLQRYNRWYIYLLAFIVVGLGWQRGIWLLSRSYVAQAFRIPSTANEPTLLVGDFIFVAKWKSARAVEADSLVVFRSIETPGLSLVKRAVGLPGDTLRMQDGVLYRNERRVDVEGVAPETVRVVDDAAANAMMRRWQVARVIRRDTLRYAPTPTDWGPLVVPVDSFFGLGDNRPDSYDSREYGFIPLSNAIGRPRVIYFSYDADEGIRWGRLGRKVR